MIAAVALLLPSIPAAAQDAFGAWMIFPGPNPDVGELLQDDDTESAFRIGQIIFDYPRKYAPLDEPFVGDLARLPSVASVVKSAESHPALDALVEQQLKVPHRFVFAQATVSDRGDAGFEWQITHELYPAKGGFSGVPFRYRTLIDGCGKVVPPRLTVFDAFFHSHDEGWTCSTLHLPADAPAPDTALTDAVIRERATEHLRAALAPRKGQQSLARAMRYRDQQRVRIPVAEDPEGAIVDQELWAVNFVAPGRKSRPDEALTVWVAADGQMAELHSLDFELNYVE